MLATASKLRTAEKLEHAEETYESIEPIEPPAPARRPRLLSFPKGFKEEVVKEEVKMLVAEVKRAGQSLELPLGDGLDRKKVDAVALAAARRDKELPTNGNKPAAGDDGNLPTCEGVPVDARDGELAEKMDEPTDGG